MGIGIEIEVEKIVSSLNPSNSDSGNIVED